MTSWTVEFVNVAKALSPFLMAVATALVAKGAEYAMHAVQGIKITNNTKANSAIQDALDWAIGQAEWIVNKAVIAENEAVVNPSKADGTWSPTVAARAFQNVLTTAEANLGTQARTTLQKDIPDLSAWLGNLITSTVPLAPNKTTVTTK